MSDWFKVSEFVPDAWVTVLTQHEDDLFPVPAFRATFHHAGDQWLRETEGPEDTYDDKRLGRHQPLYREPTHWQPLPEPPK